MNSIKYDSPKIKLKYSSASISTFSYFHRNHYRSWPRNLYTKHTLHGSMTWLFGEEMEDNKCEKKISSWCDSTHWHKTQGLRRHWSVFLGALVGRADILSLKASRTKLMEFPTKEPASFDSLPKPYVSVVGLAIKGQSNNLHVDTELQPSAGEAHISGLHSIG